MWHSLVRQRVRLISYSSDGYKTTVDYLLAQKQDRKYLKDAKAFPGEIISLHCLNEFVILRLTEGNHHRKRNSSQEEKFGS